MDYIIANNRFNTYYPGHIITFICKKRNVIVLERVGVAAYNGNLHKLVWLDSNDQLREELLSVEIWPKGDKPFTFVKILKGAWRAKLRNCEDL